MRRGRGLAALTLVAISAVVAMCVYPTEHDADVFVTIDSLTLDTLSRTPTSVGPLVVIQGAEGDVHATAWHRQSGGPSAPVPNVSFRWSVADTTLARNQMPGGGIDARQRGVWLPSRPASRRCAWSRRTSTWERLPPHSIFACRPRWRSTVSGPTPCGTGRSPRCTASASSIP